MKSYSIMAYLWDERMFPTPRGFHTRRLGKTGTLAVRIPHTIDVCVNNAILVVRMSLCVCVHTLCVCVCVSTYLGV